MNAHTWYSHTGHDTMTPTMTATLTRRSNASSGPDSASWLTPRVWHPVYPRITARHSGRSITCQTD